MSPLRILFMGSAELAAPSLEALVRAPQFLVVGVVTQPDRPRGRDLRLQPTPVKALAGHLALPVLQPERLRLESAVQPVAALLPDLVVVVAYGQILPAAVLALPRFGCLNVHASLLPCYRGAAPIQWAILNDDPQTGVTIMKMDAGLDTGEIVAQEATAITPEDNAQTLHDRLAALGARLLIDSLPSYVAGTLAPRPQPAVGVSYARKILKEDGHLDWRQPARALWNRVRAFTPWPGAFTHQPASAKPVLLKVWRAEVVPTLAGAPGRVLAADAAGIVVGCGQQALRIVELQREGGRRVGARAFLAGHAVPVGEEWA
ncbi:MAG: methionyl-tRNA formyltransferase [Verrucomicrobia bacterium]|nr:methionyl-tRNA formyltransferase [Verrucomicrobiota bacterium]